MKLRISRLALLACCGSLLAGAGQASETHSDSEASPAETIMESPLDGSSVEAFEAGMEQVREQDGETSYIRLEGAIKYLLFYDLSVRGDRAKLYAKLDGKTPTEIMAMTAR